MRNPEFTIKDQMTDYRTGRAMDLATDLLAKASANNEDGTFVVALLAYHLLSDTGYAGMIASDMELVIQLCGRIYDEMPAADDARFSLTDYANAIAHSRSRLACSKLLALDGGDFSTAMTWLAVDKRETYSGMDHMQEPLDLDIWMD